MIRAGDGNGLQKREDEMSQLQGRNNVQTSFGKYTIALPNILPVFERTEPRTNHHWLDAIQHRKRLRRCKRAHLKYLAEKGSEMLSDLVADHRNHNRWV